MCQQILQFCSGSTKPLLLAGGLLSLILAVSIGYVGYTANAIYSDIDTKVTESRSFSFHLQLAAAVYLSLVTVFSCYGAYYDQKHSIRVLFVITTLNFVLALAAIPMVPSGQELSQPFQITLNEAFEKYNSTELFAANSSPPGSNSINSNSTAKSPPENDPTKQAENDKNLHVTDSKNHTMILGKVQARGCCGINKTDDWVNQHKKIPKSCCATPNGNNTCDAIDANHQQSCLALIGSTSLNLMIVLALIALTNFYLAIISGISAYKTYSYSEASQNAYT